MQLTRRFEIEERIFCPTCSSDDIKALFVSYDDRYGLDDIFTVVECSNCNSCFLKEAILTESISDLYEKYYPNSNDNWKSISPSISFCSKLFHPKIKYIYQLAKSSLQGGCELGYYVNKGENVLDIGCGYGNSALIVKQNGDEWTGLEINSKRCNSIKSMGLQCICGTIESIKDDYKGKFDVVLASQVIEHTSDPGQFVSSCSSVLRLGGRLILSAPNANSRYRNLLNKNWIHWHVPYHQVIFSINGLELLCTKYGLKLKKHKTISPTSWVLFQKRYERPARGNKCKWYVGSHSRNSMLSYSLLLRLKDIIMGKGDSIVAEFQKISN